MLVYDAKTKEAEAIEGRLVLNSPIDTDEIAFKATYYLTADVVCSGKITALFDLYVLGNITANEIDVKGKFVCLGKCTADSSLVVQNDIISSSIEADTIICHENISAQEIDAKHITCDGKIVVEKTLAIEDDAKSNQIIICGETAYGSGKIVANAVITGEPIDLDEGEEAIISPYVYEKETNADNESKDIIAFLSKQYCEENQYKAFLEAIMKSGNQEQKQSAECYLCGLDQADKLCSKGIEELRDLKLLLIILDAAASGWFEGWQVVEIYKAKILSHFEALASGVNPYASKPIPAKNLNIGDYIRHTTFGDGHVTGKSVTASGTTVRIDFDNYGIKALSIPVALKHIKLIGDAHYSSPEEIKASMICNVENYREWIECLKILYDNASEVSRTLYECIYDRLMSILGLKSKFVLERFQERGWSINGK